VLEAKGAFGINAPTEQWEDLMKAGIIDPTKVVRTALQNALAVAGLLLTIETMVADKPQGETTAVPPSMPHGAEGF
jgi:chaperonin GroEL